MAVWSRDRVLRRTGWALAVLAGVALLGALFVSQWDWNRARPWLQDKVRATTGIELTVEGDLQLTWHWGPPGAGGGMPRLLVRGEDLRIGAPAEASAGNAAAARGADSAAPPSGQVASLSASLRVWPLLTGRLHVDTLSVRGAQLAMARAPGAPSGPAEAPTASTKPEALAVKVDRLDVQDSALTWSDPAQDLRVTVRLQDTSADSGTDTGTDAGTHTPGALGQALRFRFEGQRGRSAFQGQGRVQPLGALLGPSGQALNIDLTASSGSARLSARGTLGQPATLEAADLALALNGQNLADLFGITGLVLPQTPRFETQGQLTGRLSPEHANWQYRGFTGSVGRSDVQGDLTYVSAQPRARLAGTLQSRELHLADLGPLLGARVSERHRRAGRLLPDTELSATRWGAMDLDLDFRSDRVFRDTGLPVHNVTVNARMDDRRLQLQPLNFDMARGQVQGRMVVNGRSTPMTAELHAQIRGVKLSTLLPEQARDTKNLGRVDGAVALRGTGRSMAQWLGSSNGQARLYVREGTLSQRLLDQAALNLGSMVVGQLFGSDREVQLRCAVADLQVTGGIARVRTARLSTDEAVVDITGHIDLGQEQFNLVVKPESREWKFFSLRSPLSVRGSFAEPQVSVQTGPLLLRAGAAVAAAVAAPAALALLPVTVPGADDDAQCAALLAQAQQPVRSGTKP